MIKRHSKRTLQLRSFLLAKIFFLSFLLHFSYVFTAKSQKEDCFKTPVIWLRADKPGNIPGQWSDVSGNGYNAVARNNQLVFDSCLYNFNKCLLLDTNSRGFYVNYYGKKDANLLVFSVYKADCSNSEKGIWSLKLDSGLNAGLSTKKLKNLFKMFKYADSTSTVPIINLVNQNWYNKNIDSAVSRLFLAGSDTLNFTGKFAEFILYDSSLAKNDIYKLHTYLAIKYGVSIKEMNYQSSNDTILWDSKKLSAYKKDIAGIGCDTVIQINQKQSSGNGGESCLTISAGPLKNSNLENTSLIAHGDFLIWGANNEPLFDSNPDTSNTSVIPFISKCKWMMKRTGKTAPFISTQMILNAWEYAGLDTIKLVISRNCDTIFHKDSSIIIPPDSIDFLNNYYFSNLHWDTDNSGADVFTFQVPAPLDFFNNNFFFLSSDSSFYNNGYKFNNNFKNKVSENYSNINGSSENSLEYCSVAPNPSKGPYSVYIKLTAISPVTIFIQDISGKLLKSLYYSGASSYYIKDVINDPGSYIITVKSDSFVRSFKQVIVN